MFAGLSAFPLTPLSGEQIDAAAFQRLISRLTAAQVDSIGVLGSTGNYMYFTRNERALVARLAVQAAQGIPVVVGIGALRTREILSHAEDAQKAGASGLLLAPVSYQPWREEEVFRMFEQVTREISIPLCVYDNPRTTHFAFSDALLARIAQLPQIASIKIPGVAGDMQAVRERVSQLVSLLPASVSVGISGDALAANGLAAGCQVWYSVVGGLFPQQAQDITRAALTGDSGEAQRLTTALQPLWALFARYGGSLRVVAAAAHYLGLVGPDCLPLPFVPIEAESKSQLVKLIDEMALA